MKNDSFTSKYLFFLFLLQANIFNFFPASVLLSSVQKILEDVCIRKIRKYIPQFALWISRLFIELTNRDDGVCLTLGYSGINKDTPGRFIIEADKTDFQTCYFNLANEEQAYKTHVRKQITESELNNRIQFKIIHLKSEMNREEKQLKNFAN